MTIHEALFGARLTTPLPDELGRRQVGGLDYDSRRVGSGFLFFAFAGQQADGRKFAAHAMERGAVAVVSDLPPLDGFQGPWIRVEHGRQALALASRNFYRRPDERLALTGITGTNGKTTTGYLTDAMLRDAGRTTALVGTIEYRLAGEALPAVNTTPESLDLLRLFAELEQRGGTHVTMEVSSHALALGRVYGFHFHTAVFTNLTRDHLDFHGTMEEYFAAKQLLFTGAGGPPPRFAAINCDDAAGRRIRTGAGTTVLSYGIERGDLRAEAIDSSFRGLRFTARHGDLRIPIESPLVGNINVYNILAACAAGICHGLSPEQISRGIAACGAVPGRFERVEMGQPFLVIVDYAHTDDALRNTLSVARKLTKKRILTVFGCGGDRDRTKRPLMGQTAGELSDFVVLTSDNPRSEDPLAIMNDALVGLRRQDVAHRVEPDREAAIRLAIEEARPGDIVVIAGKGHEPYQEIKGVRLPFDDREVARRILRGFGYGEKTKGL
ncbi:MAG: UDP-N-acetylmuramoyl-L-alanyl-D-glutamate--2,6-diaminopimelate ligase [Bryobacteraceae bacterium]